MATDTPTEYDRAVERIRAKVYEDVDTKQPGYGRKRIRKALAALGFTWRDVDRMREIAEAIEADPYHFGHTSHPLPDLAGRIASFLPPRDDG